MTTHCVVLHVHYALLVFSLIDLFRDFNVSLFDRKINFLFIERIQFSIPHFPKKWPFIAQWAAQWLAIWNRGYEIFWGEYNMIADNILLLVQTERMPFWKKLQEIPYKA